jgi:hypothetical protein
MFLYFEGLKHLYICTFGDFKTSTTCLQQHVGCNMMQMPKHHTSFIWKKKSLYFKQGKFIVLEMTPFLPLILPLLLLPQTHRNATDSINTILSILAII